MLDKIFGPLVELIAYLTNTMYNKLPKLIGHFNIGCQEYMKYTYLPIKLMGQQVAPVFEPRLNVFQDLIGRCCCDFIGEFGLDRYMDSNVYLTAKRDFQRDGNSFNRPRWHSDGFMTDDISYIWSDSQPTIFNDTDFDLTQEDIISMEEMTQQADSLRDYIFPNNSLIRMDQFSIHKVGGYVPGPRTFFKLCFSKDIYALLGNSINYMLDYDWDFQPRKQSRNIPQGGLIN